MKNRRLAFIFLLMCAALTPSAVPAQQRPERTIEEIKAEAIHRSEVGQYPLIGLDRSIELLDQVIDDSLPYSNEEAAALFLMGNTLSRRGSASRFNATPPSVS